MAYDLPEGVVDITKIFAKIGRCQIDVTLRTIANIPSELVDPGLINTIREIDVA